MNVYLGVAGWVFIIAAFVWLFRRQKRLKTELSRFVGDAGFVLLAEVPPEAAQAQVPNAYAYTGRIEHAGRTVEFLFLSGFTEDAKTTLNNPKNLNYVVHAVILPAEEANFRVEERCRAAVQTKSSWRDHFAFNTRDPLRVERLSGHRLAIHWYGLHTAKVWREKLDFLRRVLD